MWAAIALGCFALQGQALHPRSVPTSLAARGVAPQKVFKGATCMSSCAACGETLGDAECFFYACGRRYCACRGKGCADKELGGANSGFAKKCARCNCCRTAETGACAGWGCARDGGQRSCPICLIQREAQW